MPDANASAFLHLLRNLLKMHTSSHHHSGSWRFKHQLNPFVNPNPKLNPNTLLNPLIYFPVSFLTLSSPAWMRMEQLSPFPLLCQDRPRCSGKDAGVCAQGQAENTVLCRSHKDAPRWEQKTSSSLSLWQL